MKKVGLGIIGLGYVGNTHLRHGLRLDNARLIAVSDVSKKALNKARASGVKKTYDNYQQLLKDSEIDAVVVALPTHLHAECSVLVCEAGKHIFLEKPIAANVIDARQIVTAARRNSIKLMIGYPLRFNSQFCKLKKQLDDGALGDIEVAQASYVNSGPFMHRGEANIPVPVPEWWFDKEKTGGGALIDVGSHLINLLRWFFGDITAIRAQFGYRFNLDLEDSAICLAKFKSGTRALITVGWFCQKSALEIGLFGTVQYSRAEQLLQHPLVTAVQVLTTKTSKFYQPHNAELRYFTDCVARDLIPSPSGEDGLKDLEAIMLAYRNPIHLT
jgi:predicted dehydrogenase